MKQEGVIVIFFDGFSFNTRKLKFYNWSRRGTSAIILQNESEFDMSFMIALLNERVYSLLGIKGYSNADIINR